DNAHGDWQWDETVSKMFQAVYNQHGSRIDTTSGFRCPTKNNAVGGSSLGKHAYGRAFDYQKRDASRIKRANARSTACRT
ncbi:D-Ala-D-Ala carboxypeptidase family metallohydrolase, partial [Candidatus Hydrogenedentota bacterium]